MRSNALKTERETFPPAIRTGIVLAAGEGKRLQSFIRQLRGDALPKQYVNFIGTRSMLEQTYHRAEKLISRELIFTVADPRHLSYREAYQQLASHPQGTVVLQPKNRETGPGLLLPLIHLHQRSPEALVAVFPSDHYIREERLFMDHVDLAFRLIEEDPSRIILLGVQPHGPDPEYGYLVPGEKIAHLAPSGVRSVSRFVEKPADHTAQELVRQGGLWNTMVMVFKAQTLLDLIRKFVPELYGPFEKIGDAVGTGRELDIIEAVYSELKTMNFSKDFLEVLSLREPSSIAALPVRGVYWNDWGSVQRLRGDINRIGLRRHDLVQEDQFSVA
ncbi:MAG TPA: sugar phosphate nucleotidyltransferase [Candidatus Manganitrophaceae bacterium]|nr:sugar phosphate nucleotidyltransferase [Candidatus Manganitrophaceae bacterium]